MYKRPRLTRADPDEHYGPQASQEPLTDAEYEKAEQELLNNIATLLHDREILEYSTRGQSSNDAWFCARRQLLTASNFGQVCKLRPTTSHEKRAHDIVFSSGKLDTAAVRWGKEKEAEARDLLEIIISQKVTECGLFVDKEIIGLGGSPDGLVGDDAIVEIKCPWSARLQTIQEAINAKNTAVTSIFVNGNLSLINPKHSYYHQIQGQLRVTDRQFCYFMIWTPKDAKVWKIPRVPDFFDEYQRPRLIRFYLNYMIPVIANGDRPLRKQPPVVDLNKSELEYDPKLLAPVHCEPIPNISFIDDELFGGD